MKLSLSYYAFYLEDWAFSATACNKVHLHIVVFIVVAEFSVFLRTFKSFIRAVKLGIFATLTRGKSQDGGLLDLAFVAHCFLSKKIGYFSVLQYYKRFF